MFVYALDGAVSKSVSNCINLTTYAVLMQFYYKQHRNHIFKNIL